MKTYSVEEFAEVVKNSIESYKNSCDSYAGKSVKEIIEEEGLLEGEYPQDWLDQYEDYILDHEGIMQLECECAQVVDEQMQDIYIPYAKIQKYSGALVGFGDPSIIEDDQQAYELWKLVDGASNWGSNLPGDEDFDTICEQCGIEPSRVKEANWAVNGSRFEYILAENWD